MTAFDTGAAPQLTDHEFDRIRGWIHARAGIHLAPQKKALVCGRLSARLRHHRLDSFGDYYALLESAGSAEECQVAVDLLTTNETSFFREPRHFDFVRDHVLPRRDRRRPFRAWSAACSSGEEPYTLAMVLHEGIGDSGWEVFASDVSSRVLERARARIYPMERAGAMTREQLETHCLKGVGRHAGSFQVAPHVARLVRFAQVNLNADLPDLGEFDLVMLRNVMIYFDAATKQQVVDRVVACLRPGGHFLIGHAESLNGLDTPALRALAPATYVKVA